MLYLLIGSDEPGKTNNTSEFLIFVSTKEGVSIDLVLILETSTSLNNLPLFVFIITGSIFIYRLNTKSQ